MLVVGFWGPERVDRALYLVYVIVGERESISPKQINIKSQLDKGNGGKVEVVRDIVREYKRKKDPFFRGEAIVEMVICHGLKGGMGLSMLLIGFFTWSPRWWPTKMGLPESNPCLVFCFHPHLFLCSVCLNCREDAH